MERLRAFLSKAEQLPVFAIDIANNSIFSWLFALLLVAFVYAATRIATLALIKMLSKRAQTSSNKLDDLLIPLLESLSSKVLAVIAVCIAAQSLSIPPKLERISELALVAALLFQAGISAAAFIDVLLKRSLGSDEDPARSSAMGLLGFLGRLLIWSVVLIAFLDNLGVDITALIAGLGVGGIAVALAVQNILGDLLSSLSIILDKPFQVGDFIIVGDMIGSVEKIGIKTTRVKSLSGEQLIFSNSDLLSSRIRNFKRMYERRVLFGIGVTYQTPPEKLKLIAPFIREVIEQLPDTRFDRSHFKGFGASSLDFEIVYYVLGPEYNLYMDRQQELNFRILQYFLEQGIEFAYPTQTLFIEGLDETQEEQARANA